MSEVHLHRPVRRRHEYIGHVGPGGYDEVVIRGSLTDRTFNAVRISDGHVAAGMHVNDWDATDSVRALVGREATASVRDPARALEGRLAQHPSTPDLS